LFSAAKKFTFKALANLHIFETLRDCVDWQKHGHQKDGVYEIGDVNGRISVFCDMTTDGGGWTVFQRRLDGSVSFDRNWEEYKNGFGDAHGEYWLGNEIVHQLNKDVRTKIRIEAEKVDGERRNATFEGFWLEDEENNYKLHSGIPTGNETGNATEEEVILEGEWFAHDGFNFTTSDHTLNSTLPCAIYYQAGWWYHRCFNINFNGLYSATGAPISPGKCLCSFTWGNHQWSFTQTKMMIKRMD